MAEPLFSTRHLKGMKPEMEKRMPASVEWRVTAVLGDDSVEFAKNLQETLTLYTQDGFTIVQQIFREADKGMVIVGQKVTLFEKEPLTPGEDSWDTMKH